MPASNQFDFSGALGAGAPSIPGLGMLSGPGANPYSGMTGYLQQRRGQDSQQAYADALTKLRQLVGSMPQQPPVPQQGALAAPPAIEGPRTPVDAPESDTGPSTGMYDVNGYLKGLRGIESGNKPVADVNPASGAAGPYQFIEPTWRGLMRQAPELGLTAEGRTDPKAEKQHERAVRYLTDQNAKELSTNLKRMPTHAELYAAHFFGPGFATAVLKNPETPIEALVPESFIKANPMLKGLDGKTFLRLFGKRFNS